MKELNDITIKQAASGNNKAFKKLYDYYSSFVWKVVYRIVNGNHSEAQSIMQNIFIKVHKVLSKFKFNSSFSTWLYRIVYNESMSYLGKKKSLNSKKVEYKETLGKAEKSDNYENKDLVKTILYTLNPEERFLIVSREVNDIPFDELAVIMGKKSGTLRTMIHRIKENIRKGICYETGRILPETV